MMYNKTTTNVTVEQEPTGCFYGCADEELSKYVLAKIVNFSQFSTQYAHFEATLPNFPFKFDFQDF